MKKVIETTNQLKDKAKDKAEELKDKTVEASASAVRSSVNLYNETKDKLRKMSGEGDKREAPSPSTASAAPEATEAVLPPNVIQLRVTAPPGRVQQTYNYDLTKPLSKHIDSLCSLFKCEDGSEHYHLYSDIKRKVIADEDMTVDNHVLNNNSMVQLRLDNKVAAKRAVSNLGTSSGEIVKQTTFNLRNQLSDGDFSEWFIEMGGMPAILNVLQESEGNTQAYCLVVLRMLMGFVSGMDALLNEPELINRLMTFVDSPNLTVCRQSLELLFVICQYAGNGFNLVHKAVKFAARSQGKPPYGNLVNLLDCADLDTQVNSLTLINCLLTNAPNKHKLTKLLHRLEAQGIIRVLKAQTSVEDQKFKIQMGIFQSYSGVTIPKSWYEVDQYKGRLNDLTILYEKMEEKLKDFEKQQPMIRILRAEVLRSQAIFKKAHEMGAYITPNAPQRRAAQQGKLDKLQDNLHVSDLDFLLDTPSYKMQAEIDSYDGAFKEMENKLKDEALARQTLQNKLEELIKLNKANEDEKAKARAEAKAARAEAVAKGEQVKRLSEASTGPGTPKNNTAVLLDEIQVLLEESQHVLPTTPKGRRLSAVHVEGASQTRQHASPSFHATVPTGGACTEVNCYGKPFEDNLCIYHYKKIIQGVGVKKTDVETNKTNIVAGKLESVPETPAANIPPPAGPPPGVEVPAAPTAPPPAAPAAAAPAPAPAPPPPPGIKAPGGAPPPPAPPPPAVKGAPPPPAPPAPPIAGGKPPPPAPPPPGGKGGPPAPPPPPGKGAPPPPPGMGGAAMARPGVPQPTKPVIKPNAKMKQLHWNRVLLDKQNKNRQKCVWDVVKEIKIDGKDLESKFATKEAGKMKLKETSKSGAKPAEKSPLPVQRANALAIMLSRMPAIPVIKDAIVNLDDNKMKKDQLETLRANLPTAEEIEMIQAADSKGRKWDSPETLILMLAKIPKLNARLRAWSFKQTFDEQIEAAAGPLTMLEKCIKEVRNSKHLVYFLGVILSIGNYMNGGNANKGQADGFNMDFLLKLNDTKDMDGETLLTYSMKVLAKNNKDCLNLPTDLHSCKAASKLSLEDLDGLQKKLSNQVKDIERACNHIIASTEDADDKFNTAMPKFLKEAAKSVNNIHNQFTKVQQSFQDLLVYYGYSESQAKVKKTEDFFGLLHNFSTVFKESIPKEPKNEASAKPARKHEAGMKIGGGTAADPMSVMIDAIKGGKANLRKAEGAPPTPGPQGMGFDPAMLNPSVLKKTGKGIDLKK